MTEYSTSFGMGGGTFSVTRGVNTFVPPTEERVGSSVRGRLDEAYGAWSTETGRGLTALDNAIHSEDPSVEPFRENSKSVSTGPWLTPTAGRT